MSAAEGSAPGEGPAPANGLARLLQVSQRVGPAGASLDTNRRACRLASTLDARQAAVRVNGNAQRIRLRANRVTGSGTPQTTRLKLCGQPRIQAALSGSGSKPEG